MAGVRQHILPRFLLKGFASRGSGKHQFAWVYKHKADAFETNINNIAVEKYFYGDSNNPVGDEKITGVENELAEFVDEVRFFKDGKKLNSFFAAKLVTHLSVRAKHIRQFTGNAAEVLIGSLTGMLSDTNLFYKAFIQDKGQLEKGMNENLEKQGVPQSIRPIFVEVGFELLPYLLKNGIMQNIIIDLFKQATANLPSIIKTAHVETMAESPIPERRVNDLKLLDWIVKRTNQSLILSDAPCVFELDRGRRYQSLPANCAAISKVFLPISDNVLIIGSKNEYLSDAISCDINAESANISREFFISSKRNKENFKLSFQIGSTSELLTEEKAQEILLQSLAKRQSTGSRE